LPLILPLPSTFSTYSSLHWRAASHPQFFVLFEYCFGSDQQKSSSSCFSFRFTGGPLMFKLNLFQLPCRYSPPHRFFLGPVFLYVPRLPIEFSFKYANLPFPTADKGLFCLFSGNFGNCRISCELTTGFFHLSDTNSLAFFSFLCCCFLVKA